MEQFTICAIIAGVLAACGAGVGVHVYHSNKLNKKHKQWQDVQGQFQKEIDRLKDICKKKDEQINDLANKGSAADAKLKEEVAKRTAILKIIEELEKRIHTANSGEVGTVGVYAVISASTISIATALVKKPFSREAELAQMYDSATSECKELIATTAGITASCPMSVIKSVAARVADTVLIENCASSAQRLLAVAQGGL